MQIDKEYKKVYLKRKLKSFLTKNKIKHQSVGKMLFISDVNFAKIQLVFSDNYTKIIDFQRNRVFHLNANTIGKLLFKMTKFDIINPNFKIDK